MKEYETASTISAPPEHVWSVLVDGASYRAWNPEIVGIDGELARGARITAHVRLGDGAVRKVGERVVEFDPPRRMTWVGGLPLGLFDRELADVFTIQSEIAQTIADTLKATLSPESRQRMAARPTTDTLAYRFFLQARAGYNRRTPDGFARGLELLQKAIQRDSNFALAYASLSGVYTLIPRAIALEPSNQIGWSTLFQGAWYGNHAEEAFDALVRMQELSGVHAVTRSELSAAFANGGRTAVLRVLLAKWPENYRPTYRAVWYAELGDRDHALELLERGYDERWAGLPYVLRSRAFDAMRSDPRFIAYMKKIGLPPAA
jgi:uncharacterized protein YndB with AHSA1/START domain